MARTDRLALTDQAKTCVRLASRAQRHYETWRVLTDPVRVRRYRTALDRYSDLFILDEHAHFGMCLVHLSALFESREGTVNVGQLLAAASVFDPAHPLLVNVEKTLATARPTISKVMIIRSSAIAHRHDRYSYNDIFKRAQLTPDQLNDLVNHAESIAWDLAHFFKVKPWNEALYAPSQLEEILDRLDRELSDGWGSSALDVED